jgi:hypothetical protein
MTAGIRQLPPVAKTPSSLTAMELTIVFCWDLYHFFFKYKITLKDTILLEARRQE